MHLMTLRWHPLYLVAALLATACSSVSHGAVRGPTPQEADRIAVAAVGPTEVDGAFDLSVANIMRGEELVGRSPDEVRWSADSRYVYYRWRDPESPDSTTWTFRAQAAGGDPERLAPDSVPASAAVQGRWSADG